MRKIVPLTLKVISVNAPNSDEHLRRAYFRILSIAKQAILEKRMAITIKPLRFRKVTIVGSCIV